MSRPEPAGDSRKGTQSDNIDSSVISSSHQQLASSSHPAPPPSSSSPPPPIPCLPKLPSTKPSIQASPSLHVSTYIVYICTLNRPPPQPRKQTPKSLMNLKPSINTTKFVRRPLFPAPSLASPVGEIPLRCSIGAAVVCCHPAFFPSANSRVVRPLSLSHRSSHPSLGHINDIIIPSAAKKAPIRTHRRFSRHQTFPFASRPPQRERKKKGNCIFTRVRHTPRFVRQQSFFFFFAGQIREMCTCEG